MSQQITLHRGNALDILKNYSKEFDLVITSPPYNTSKRTGASDAYNKRYDQHKDNMSFQDYLQWTVQYFNTFNNILKENGVILYNLSYGTEGHEASNLLYSTISTIYNETEFCVADTIIWKKKSAIPNNVSPNKITRIAEFVFVIVRKSEFKSFKANKTVKSVSKVGQKFYENVFNFLEASNNDGSNNLNKATFSTDLVLQLLERYAKPSENTKILDPFHGTGTTANACLHYGVKCVGIEISQEQHEFAIERLKKTKQDLEMNSKGE